MSSEVEEGEESERRVLRHWLREDEVAKRLSVPAEKLRRWRSRGQGPLYLAWNGEYVIYDPASVEYFRRHPSPVQHTRIRWWNRIRGWS